ncbi:mediator complex subunit 26 [Leptinotarsa decemlineata]|uniref:mediator complex subunit 26 n=1 Tax=Leptinotarsa decemlineata TaxID=7539 RepID=UPI000C252E6B|nr:mediator of RNA polymerase II transcription subunit 26 [Leptinotarsa decemlineata]
MQNNVTELTQRLLRSLDSNYNVIDMPAVVEIISLLDKVAITKELLETTRLGKYINELRRKTTNESLSKRAKELVKKWRNAVLPESNGQLKQSPPLQQSLTIPTRLPSNQDVNLNQVKTKKRPAKDSIDNINAKRVKLNGGISELDFSDNSNSSFKDVIPTMKTEPKRGVIIINSDSNSSIPDKQDPLVDQQMPKKRGRKKGSRNHKKLLDEAESSFTSKLAVSRGNSKVKTTQELLASLQNKNSNSALNLTVKPKEDLMEKAAKLTERVSIIDQQLNTNANRNKNSQRSKYKLEKNERILESGSVINDKSLLNDQQLSLKKEEEDVNVVDTENDEIKSEGKEENQETENSNFKTSLSVEEALKQLPPVDESVLLDDEGVRCSCTFKENKSDFSVEEDVEADVDRKFEFIEDHNCQAKFSLRKKYHLNSVTDEQVRRLHHTFIPNVNGNFSIGSQKPGPELQENGLYVNVVPNLNIESIPKDVKNFSGESYSRYSFSDTGGVKSEIKERTGDEVPDSGECFKEWHEVIDTPSYDGEILKILPYVIID